MTLDLRQALLSTYPNPVIKPRAGKATFLNSLYGIHIPPPRRSSPTIPSLDTPHTSRTRSFIEWYAEWVDTHIGWLVLASLLSLAIAAVALSR